MVIEVDRPGFVHADVISVFVGLVCVLEDEASVLGAFVVDVVEEEEGEGGLGLPCVGERAVVWWVPDYAVDGDGSAIKVESNGSAAGFVSWWVSDICMK
jgi:hypothetical protein